MSTVSPSSVKIQIVPNVALFVLEAFKSINKINEDCLCTFHLQSEPLLHRLTEVHPLRTHARQSPTSPLSSSQIRESSRSSTCQLGIPEKYR